ncbi:hypothetical protein PVK06_004891 [Gossypium arboreum]|uniref:Uncharacterized protein n=1 Tax=Gossypium arboreum TaxID=29729 RepID=A0ABR0QUG3_GOSAR|nr:hypothetical protein PVK06_004891 [Gossypium arboreum]
MDAAMNKMVEEHEAIVRKMAKEKKSAMVSLEQKHTEALKGFKKEILQNFTDFLLELKANILLHAQVPGGPFDACKVDFDALCDVVSDKLGFDVYFPSGATLEEFVSK